MAREVSATPKKWIDEGVWYVPDVGDNQTLWREYVALREKKELDAKEVARLAELERETKDLFEVKIGPYSHDEVSRIEAAARRRALEVKVDRKSEDVTFSVDPLALGEDQVLDVCAKRIFEVRGYVAREAVLEEETLEPRLDADGNIVTTTRRITDGAELVKLIRTQADPEEMKVLEDIFEAIKSRSHLSRGQKKTFRAPHGS